MPGLDNQLQGVVDFVSYLGANIDVHVRLPSKERVIVQIPNREDGLTLKTGDSVHVGWAASTGALFSGEARSAEALQ